MDAILTEVLEVAVSAAKSAGALIRSRSGGALASIAIKANDKDLATEVDQAAEAAIFAAIQRSFPDHAFLGEESVAPGSVASAAAIAAVEDQDWLWVVDPLDGTTNFIHDLAHSVVSIGVAHRGVVVVAVIYDPYRDELFSAVRGRGAHCNGERMRISSTPSLSTALFAVGFHSRADVAAAMVRASTALLGACRGIRCLGSAALHLAYVARGAFTGFFELDLNSWDLAAGSLLVEEAGGRMSDSRGVAYTLATRDCYATNGAEGVHAAGLALLAGAGANAVPRVECGAAAPTASEA